MKLINIDNPSILDTTMATVQLSPHAPAKLTKNIQDKLISAIENVKSEEPKNIN